MSTQQEGSHLKPGRVTKNQIVQQLHLGKPSLQNCEKTFFFYLSHSVRCSLLLYWRLDGIVVRHDGGEAFYLASYDLIPTLTDLGLWPTTSTSVLLIKHLLFSFGRWEIKRDEGQECLLSMALGESPDELCSPGLHAFVMEKILDMPEVFLFPHPY